MMERENRGLNGFGGFWRLIDLSLGFSNVGFYPVKAVGENFL